MFGIQGRLTLLFVVIVTLVLGISGTYAQYSLGHELEVGSQRLREGVLTRLQTSLPSALWDLDKTKVDNIVAAEMLPPELVSIRVYDTSVGLFSGKLRRDDGTLVSIENDAAVAGTPVVADLAYRDSGTSGNLRMWEVGVEPCGRIQRPSCHSKAVFSCAPASETRKWSLSSPRPRA